MNTRTSLLLMSIQMLAEQLVANIEEILEIETSPQKEPDAGPPTPPPSADSMKRDRKRGGTLVAFKDELFRESIHAVPLYREIVDLTLGVCFPHSRGADLERRQEFLMSGRRTHDAGLTRARYVYGRATQTLYPDATTAQIAGSIRMTDGWAYPVSQGVVDNDLIGGETVYNLSRAVVRAARKAYPSSFAP